MSTVTRTDLLALLAAYTEAEGRRMDASIERYATLTPLNSTLVRHHAARVAATVAYKALLDGISALDIPA